jgi:hypothetical protein
MPERDHRELPLSQGCIDSGGKSRIIYLGRNRTVAPGRVGEIHRSLADGKVLGCKTKRKQAKKR